uniref:Uncharacterized protein n=1 Tax=viral metagenome TaxID=1070528 RepID=A0A6C0EBE7_9ZZZZ
MGSLFSNPAKNQKYYSTQSVQNNIETLLRASGAKLSASTDSFKFTNSLQKRNAFDSYGLTSVSDFDLSSFSEMMGGGNYSLNAPTRQRYAQYENRFSNNAVEQVSIPNLENLLNPDYQQTGGCGCDMPTPESSFNVDMSELRGGYTDTPNLKGGSKNTFSATSSQPIDYSILKGGSNVLSATSPQSSNNLKNGNTVFSATSPIIDVASLIGGKHNSRTSSSSIGLNKNKDSSSDTSDDSSDSSKSGSSSSSKSGSSSSSNNLYGGSSSASATSQLKKKYHSKEYAITTDSDSSNYVINAKQFYSSDSGNLYGSPTNYLRNNKTNHRIH